MEFNLSKAVNDQALLLQYRNTVIFSKPASELGKKVEKYEKWSLNYVISRIGYTIMSIYDSSYLESWHEKRGRLFLKAFTTELTQNALRASEKTDAASSSVLGASLPGGAAVVAPLAPLGLPNVRNSCYLNSVTQMILSMEEEDKNALIRTIPYKEMRDAFIAVAGYTKRSDATTEGLEPLMTALRDSIFKIGNQEFPEADRLKQQDGQALLNLILDGRFINFKTTATVNGPKRNKFKPQVTNANNTMISTPVAQEGFFQRWVMSQTMSGCLNTYCNENVDDVNGARYFEKTDGTREKVSNFKIESRINSEPPKYIFMHYNRTEFDKITFSPSKIKSQVGLPSKIDLSTIATQEIQEKCKGRLVYEPSAVIFHYGNGPKSGHYTANVKKDGQWFDCNDEAVNPLNFYSIDNQNSYVVMLKRKEA